MGAPLVGEGGTSCAAILLEGDHGPSVVFWLADEIFPETLDTPGLLAIIASDRLDGLSFRSELDLVQPAHSLRPEPGESACETFSGIDDAPTVVPSGVWRLVQIGTTDADCARLHLTPAAVASPDDAEEHFDLCALREELPFSIDVEPSCGYVGPLATPEVVAWASWRATPGG